MTEEVWIRDEGYVCEGCGESFRYKFNLDRHKEKCLDIRFNKKY